MTEMDHAIFEATTRCRLWRLQRADGQVFGFTDHDCDLHVEGLIYRANSGFTASALQQVSGLAVDNTEVAGALTASAISEEDLAAGRYDGAEVRIWLADWSNLGERQEIFRGTLGEITRRGAAFSAEIRGLSEPLNQQAGQVYSRGCSAVLGDRRCKFDLDRVGYRHDCAIENIDREGRVFLFAGFAEIADRWFDNGRLEVMSGAAKGLSAMIKTDRNTSEKRRIELWQGICARLEKGDEIRLWAGCDKRAETCRTKFSNFVNFRGFPHLPGDDWLTASPQAGRTSGA